jgi:hypothetical protein
MGLDDAAHVIGLGFPADRTILPSPDLTMGIVERCYRAGIDGGAVYDALVALTAADAGHVLITRDERAASTYERLGIEFTLLRAASSDVETPDEVDPLDHEGTDDQHDDSR